MPDYEKMYYTLFNAITDAMDAVTHSHSVIDAMKILSDAQIKTEEIYITSSEQEDAERTQYLNSFMPEK